VAGLFFVRPGARSHADKHPGLEEVYHIFAGRGQVLIDGEPHDVEAGDIVFIPDGAMHYLVNDGARWRFKLEIVRRWWAQRDGGHA